MICKATIVAKRAMLALLAGMCLTVCLAGCCTTAESPPLERNMIRLSDVE
ncbi:MAG: hypothetical protein V1746_02110 [bacterium]